MTGESVLFDLIYLLMLRMNERRKYVEGDLGEIRERHKNKILHPGHLLRLACRIS